MIGAIIGDIVGSRFEFANATTTKFDLFDGYCDITDDTICTIAIADAAMTDKDYRAALLRWCRKYPFPKGGYGGRFSAWLNSAYPQPYNSLGNGSAMRVSPIAWLSSNLDEIRAESEAASSVTHNHPEGIKGARVIAECIWLLRGGVPKRGISCFVRREYGSIPKFEPFSNRFDETCMNAVPVAVSCFLESTSFESAIRNAILVGGDSDTIGAITGSLAEAHYGIPPKIIHTALGYVPNEMKRVYDDFRSKIVY